VGFAPVPYNVEIIGIRRINLNGMDSESHSARKFQHFTKHGDYAGGTFSEGVQQFFLTIDADFGCL
jgi:hypothetical protein